MFLRPSLAQSKIIAETFSKLWVSQSDDNYCENMFHFSAFLSSQELILSHFLAFFLLVHSSC